MTGGVDPLLYARARQLISERTGFRDDAIAPESLERVVRSELARGRNPDELRSELDRPDSEFSLVMVRAALVGETYFFRHPEHFRFIAREGAPRVLSHGVTILRGWSAGCATGEEAYSLAACLLACVNPGVSVEVVGTDLNEGSLVTARRATYGAWSRRESGPHLFPLYRPLEDRQVSIFESVRHATRFMVANLLSPVDALLGQFHFILCRNVLTYFTAQSREQAIANILRALAPGGYLFLGTVEVDGPPAGLVRVGPPELQAFHRPLVPESPAAGASRPASRTGLPAITPIPMPSAAGSPPRPASRTGLPAITPIPMPPGALASQRPPSSSGMPTVAPAALRPPAARPRSASELHLEALERIEKGDVSRATSMLEALVRQFPDYLPGLLELALLRERNGSRAAAYPLMRAVHARAAELPPDQIVEGPEALPARFYKASADAYLNLGASE
ncbi:MAG: CheR family methyltransferase [Hyalangium sp.]|uniref:CheR family methyltransferase n=1 Tax=Hyalangium sp. TaxID=2028555 RepID=UPI003899EC6C